MKRLLLAISLSLLMVLQACSKGHLGSSSGVTGAWLEMEATGGIGGGTTRFNNELRILRLNKDSTWSFRSNAVTRSGTYHLSTIMNGGQPATLITYTTDNGGYWPGQIIIEQKDGRLVLSDIFPDGYTSIYVRWIF